MKREMETDSKDCKETLRKVEKREIETRSTVETEREESKRWN